MVQRQTLDQLAEYLAYELEEGRETVEQERETLASVARKVKACRRCPLGAARTQAVPGQGNATPEILFVGEAPGADEDRQGLAFVGAEGQLLSRMIEAMGYTREQVFITNVVKCRPPDNRPPLPDELSACRSYLLAQVRRLRPKAIVALGAVPTRAMLGTETAISQLRGQWHTFENIRLMPTYHPAYLLRNPKAKHEVWNDLKAVLAFLGRTPPARQSKTET